MKKFLFSFVACLMIGSCQQPSDNNPDNIFNLEVREKQNAKDSIPLDEDIESIQYIPLETNESCFISNALDLQISDQYIFVYNGKTEQILQFSRTGKFIKQIGRSGNGPGEFSSILNIAIDNSRKELYIFQYSAPPVVYSLDGSFLHSDTIRATNMFALNNGYRVLKGLTMAPVKYAPWMAALQNAKQETVDSIIPYSTSWINEFCFMENIVFSPSVNQSVLTFTECNDTVFRISQQGIKPVCVLKRNNSHNYHKNIADIRQLQNHPAENTDIQLIDMFETDHFLYFRFIGNDYFIQRISKKDGTLLSHKVKKEFLDASVRIPGENVIGLENNFDGGVAFWPEFYVDSQTRAQIVTAENISRLKSKSLLKNPPMELKAMDEYDNPIIILYKFKSEYK